jgi:hypothetical protein
MVISRRRRYERQYRLYVGAARRTGEVNDWCRVKPRRARRQQGKRRQAYATQYYDDIQTISLHRYHPTHPFKMIAPLRVGVPPERDHEVTQHAQRQTLMAELDVNTQRVRSSALAR